MIILLFIQINFISEVYICICNYDTENISKKLKFISEVYIIFFLNYDTKIISIKFKFILAKILFIQKSFSE